MLQCCLSGKITTENKTLYLNATVLETLPWSQSQAENVLNAAPEASAMLSSVPGQARTPQPALRSGGEDDPYADLLWLTVPGLKTLNGASLSALLQERGSLAFQSQGHNDTLGAPFMITGSQSWLKPGASRGPRQHRSRCSLCCRRSRWQPLPPSERPTEGWNLPQAAGAAAWGKHAGRSPCIGFPAIGITLQSIWSVKANSLPRCRLNGSLGRLFAATPEFLSTPVFSEFR
ncbi:hypothetical protein ACFTAO_15025 [Paenibacillus rhizoplanae]